jgi:hypothetical protein
VGVRGGWRVRDGGPSAAAAAAAAAAGSPGFFPLSSHAAAPHLLERHHKLLVFLALVVQLLLHALAPPDHVAHADPCDLRRPEKDDRQVAAALVRDVAQVRARKLLGEDLGLRGAEKERRVGGGVMSAGQAAAAVDRRAPRAGRISGQRAAAPQHQQRQQRGARAERRRAAKGQPAVPVPRVL